MKDALRLEAERIERLVQELQTCGTFELYLKPDSVFQFVAVMQLAGRHPEITDSARETIDKFIAGARAYFSECPTILGVIAEGERTC